MRSKSKRRLNRKTGRRSGRRNPGKKHVKSGRKNLKSGRKNLKSGRRHRRLKNRLNRKSKRRSRSRRRMVGGGDPRGKEEGKGKRREGSRVRVKNRGFKQDIASAYFRRAREDARRRPRNEKRAATFAKERGLQTQEDKDREKRKERERLEAIEDDDKIDYITLHLGGEEEPNLLKVTLDNLMPIAEMRKERQDLSDEEKLERFISDTSSALPEDEGKVLLVWGKKMITNTLGTLVSQVKYTLESAEIPEDYRFQYMIEHDELFDHYGFNIHEMFQGVIMTYVNNIFEIVGKYWWITLADGPSVLEEFLVYAIGIIKRMEGRFLIDEGNGEYINKEYEIIDMSRADGIFGEITEMASLIISNPVFFYLFVDRRMISQLCEVSTKLDSLLAMAAAPEEGGMSVNEAIYYEKASELMDEIDPLLDIIVEEQQLEITDSEKSFIKQTMSFLYKQFEGRLLLNLQYFICFLKQLNISVTDKLMPAAVVESALVEARSEVAEVDDKIENFAGNGIIAPYILTKEGIAAAAAATDADDNEL